MFTKEDKLKAQMRKEKNDRKAQSWGFEIVDYEQYEHKRRKDTISTIIVVYGGILIFFLLGYFMAYAQILMAAIQTTFG